MAKQDIVVIGGSAGSSRVLKTLLQELPADFGGTLFITTHMSAQHPSYLASMLAANARIPVLNPEDGQPIEPGRAYIATPDKHLLLMESTIRLGRGPRENMSRPAIDPMFRSAALSFGPRVVGVQLSGMLNDGVSGLCAIRDVGGTIVVQHPLDAQRPDMPRAALEAVDADHVVAAAGLAELLTGLVKIDAGPALPIPESLAFEVDVAAGARLGSANLRQFAEPAALTCPDCDGVLSEVRGQQPLRYRCQIGHAYTAEQLAAKHERVDEALRIAMRVMEERLELVERMARDARATGRIAVAELYESRATEYRRYAQTLRDATLSAQQPAPEVEVAPAD
jgi:two-component system, chemotaxis family, protein-glutamate methylesterase/glutaminase